MKGISLATDSIIIIILAVLVLAALLIFFGSVWIPGSNQVVDTMKQAQLCGDYVRLNPNCDVSVDVGNILVDIKKVCGGLCSVLDSDTTCAPKCCRTWCVGGQYTCDGTCIETAQCADSGQGTCPSGEKCCKI
ncbi:MAG: hypothetical protein NT129_06180 [Candidatus Aenigmarchaeota archaeon]|nr:hypothetical protein [Candidatus Aenigmarchaeota archaeon]